MTDKFIVHRLLLFSFISFQIVGCVDTPRSHPSENYPASIPPAVKETKSLGTSWENEFGLVQAVRVSGVIFVSGQLALDEKGMILGKGSMEAQMRQAYANVAKVLQQFHVTLNDVLEETIYVTDMPVALVAGPKVRRDVYGEHPTVATTLVQVQRLAFTDAVVEVRVVAKGPALQAPPSSTTQSGPQGHRGGRGRSGGLGGSSPF